MTNAEEVGIASTPMMAAVATAILRVDIITVMVWASVGYGLWEVSDAGFGFGRHGERARKLEGVTRCDCDVSSLTGSFPPRGRKWRET
jgi:hypothetical protein